MIETLTQVSCTDCGTTAVKGRIQDHQWSGWTTLSWRLVGASPDHDSTVQYDLCPKCTDAVAALGITRPPLGQRPIGEGDE